MDTNRWKSILVPRGTYEEIKAMSKVQGRTIGGQLRLVFDWYKESTAVLDAPSSTLPLPGGGNSPRPKSIRKGKKAPKAK